MGLFFQTTFKIAYTPSTRMSNPTIRTWILILYLFSLPFWAYRQSFIAAGSSQLMTDAETGVKMNIISECLMADHWDFFALTYWPPIMSSGIFTSLMLFTHVLSLPLSTKANSNLKCYGWPPTRRTTRLGIKSVNQIIYAFHGEKS